MNILDKIAKKFNIKGISSQSAVTNPIDKKSSDVENEFLARGGGEEFLIIFNCTFTFI